MTADFALRLAFGFNIVVLVPVVSGLYAHRGPGIIGALGGEIYNVDGLRLLIVSLWTAVLLMSIGGLFRPRLFVTVLLFQVIYKAIYLAIYVAPVVTDRGWSAAPWGPTIVFTAILVVYPFVIAKAWG